MSGVLLALPLGAQQQGRDERAAPVIPQSALPPAGLCRVWLSNVPAGRQPAPTDCATAIRNRPPNAMVLFGDLRGEPGSPWPSRAMAPRATSRLLVGPSRMLDPSGAVRNMTVGAQAPAMRAAVPESGGRPVKPPRDKPPEKPKY